MSSSFISNPSTFARASSSSNNNNNNNSSSLPSAPERRFAILESEVEFAKICDELREMPPSEAISRVKVNLESKVRTIKRQETLVYAYNQFFRTKFPQEYARWKANFEEATSLDRYLLSLEAEDSKNRVIVETICRNWEHWDWQIAPGYTPEGWSGKMLAKLRYIALRTKDWAFAVRRLQEVARARVVNRTGMAGVPVSSAVCTMDLAAVGREIEEMNQREAAQRKLDLESQQQQQQQQAGSSAQDETLEPSATQSLLEQIDSSPGRERSIELGRGTQGPTWPDADLFDDEIHSLPGDSSSSSSNNNNNNDNNNSNDDANDGDNDDDNNNNSSSRKAKRKRGLGGAAPDRNLRLRPVFGPTSDLIEESRKRVARDRAALESLRAKNPTDIEGITRAGDLVARGEQALAIAQSLLEALPQEWK